MINEALHDIKLLGKVMDMDNFIFALSRGQSNFIYDNLVAYFSGEDRELHANIHSATVLISNEGIAVENTDLMSSDWTTYGNLTRSSDAGVVTLNSNNNNDPCGVSYSLNVQEGDVIYIRAFAKRTAGIINNFAIGSSNVNQGLGSTSRFVIDDKGEYVGHFIECQHKETITINIDANNGASTANTGQVAISDLSISYVNRSELYLQPLNTEMKSRVNVLESEIQNIINNM
jgi:hypothetical protein